VLHHFASWAHFSIRNADKYKFDIEVNKLHYFILFIQIRCCLVLGRSVSASRLCLLLSAANSAISPLESLLYLLLTSSPSTSTSSCDHSAPTSTGGRAKGTPNASAIQGWF